MSRLKLESRANNFMPYHWPLKTHKADEGWIYRLFQYIENFINEYKIILALLFLLIFQFGLYDFDVNEYMGCFTKCIE